MGHTQGTLGCCHGNIPQKTRQESPFPPSSKGEGRKSVQGFSKELGELVNGGGCTDRAHPHLPSSGRNPGDCCSVGSRGAAKLTVATAPMRNRVKQQGKDFYIRQTSPSHLQGAQGAATGIKSASKRCADGDLSPAILLLFPADWDCKFPPPVTPP